MSLYSDWNSRDLARASNVTEDQIWVWFHEGKLRGKVSERGVLRLPLTEAVVAYALRDGKNPDKAREELIAGREKPFVHHGARRTKFESENALQDFLVNNRLPQPKRDYWGDGDPRREKE